MPPARRHTLFLCHPQAGGGGSVARLERLLARAPGLAGPHESVEVRSGDEVCEALRGLPPDGVPVAVGGDGMVSLVTAALRSCGRADTALAILPLGTSNILARTLGLGDVGRALSAVREGRPRPVDVMRTSHPSAPVAVVSLSAGFEGRFLMRYGLRRRSGRALAALAAATETWGRADPMTLELDGQAVLRPDETVFGAGLYNTPLYTAGIVMSPDADPADGLGESVVYGTARAFWATMARGLVGGGGRPATHVVRRRWRSARLESRGPLQIDGEHHPPGDVSVWMEPAGLKVLVP